MEFKTIIVGLIIGLVVGGFAGFAAAPRPDVTGLNLQIDELKGQVNNFEAEVAQLQQQVITLQNNVSSKITEISNLEAELHILEDEKNALEVSLETKDSEISLFKEEVEQLEGQVGSLENEVLSLRSGGNLTFVAVSFSRTEDTSMRLQYWIGRANETIRVMVMLITQDKFADALIAANIRGVDVDIIIDSDWEFSSGSDYQEILNAGIDIRGDDRSGLMHHKVMIIDGYVVITGSYNWSASAEDSNDENTIILKSQPIAQTYLEEFNRIWNQTTPESPPEPEPEPKTGRIVINEVELNPTGTDTGHEWVELYNPTDQAVDIGGWKIETTHGRTVTITIPSGTVLDSGEYWTYTYSKQWLDNENEIVVLKDASFTILDTTPTLNDDANDSHSWARFPDGYDTDSSLDWVFQTSTKGRYNG